MESANSNATHHITELIDQVRNGDVRTRNAAMWKLMDEYGEQLRGQAQRHLSCRVSQRGNDPEVIADSALRTFFMNPRRINNRRSLASFLVKVVTRKAANYARYEMRKKRDVRQETPLLNSDEQAGQSQLDAAIPVRPFQPLQDFPTSDIDVEGLERESDDFFDQDVMDVLTYGATPPQALFAVDLIEKLPLRLKQVALAKLDGDTDENIARRLNKGVRTVQRDIKAIQTQWCRWAGSKGWAFRQYLNADNETDRSSIVPTAESEETPS